MRKRASALEFSDVLEQVRQRDRRDRERAVSPLVRAHDSVYVDNTAMSRGRDCATDRLSRARTRKAAKAEARQA